MRARTTTGLAAAALAGGLTFAAAPSATAIPVIDGAETSSKTSIGALCQQARVAGSGGTDAVRTAPSLIEGKPGLRCGQAFAAMKDDTDDTTEDTEEIGTSDAVDETEAPEPVEETETPEPESDETDDADEVEAPEPVEETETPEADDSDETDDADEVEDEDTDEDEETPEADDSDEASEDDQE